MPFRQERRAEEAMQMDRMSEMDERISRELDESLRTMKRFAVRLVFFWFLSCALIVLSLLYWDATRDRSGPPCVPGCIVVR